MSSYVSLSVVQPRARAWENKYLVPSYGEIAPFIAEGLQTADELGMIIYNPYCGVPPCIGQWWKRIDRNVEYSDNKNGIKTNNISNPDKIKAAQCLSCDLFDLCNGVWREYAAIHGFKDLRPLAESDHGMFVPGEDL
jgi:hypothetical protein